MPTKLEQIELRSESVQEVLSNPPSWMIRWGLTVILIALFMILAASWFIKYPDFITAQVLVTTQNPPEKIEARINGKLEKLFVKNHDKVIENQSLGLIENTANYQDLIQLRNVIDTLQVNYNNFQFPFELFVNHSFGDVETDFINFERAFTDYSLNKKLSPFAPETLASSQAISEINARIQSLQSQKKIELAKLNLKKQDLNRNQSLYENGVISAQEMEAKKLEFLQAQQNFENIDLSISQLIESKSTVNKTLSGTKITKQQTETGQIKSLLQSYDQLKKSVTAWEQNYLLKSSTQGEISFQTFWGENQMVSPGEVIFTIIPSQSNLVGRLTVPTQNSGKIKAGQKVLVKLDNFPYQQFGVVTGKVKSISLSPDADGNYFVEITLPNNLTTSHNQKLPFDKELRGTADIVTEDLRLIERFFYQFREVFQYQ